MAHVYPIDWSARKFEHISTKNNSERLYELELIEFTFSDPTAPILLMVPGYFQNAYVFDLLPEAEISLARYIANTFLFHIFALHPNGIGHSDYIKKSDIDDIAIDDILGAVSVLRNSYKKKIYLMGHSNGAICIQCYLAGLTRSEAGNVFDGDVSQERQLHIDGAILFAGNVCMTDDTKKSSLQKFALFGLRVEFILRRINWINARLLTRIISPTKFFKRLSVAYWNIWNFLYHIKNVTLKSREALYTLTLNGTSAATLIQYSKGVVNGCIRTTADIDYSAGLSNIQIPTVQVTFEFDPLAVPGPTLRDNFSRIGTLKKKFFTINNQGHEDFMMVKDFHQIVKEPITYLLEVA